jgi:hypothetical protein
MKYLLFSLVLFIVSNFGFSQVPVEDTISTFSIQLSPEACTTSSKYNSLYEEKINEKKGIRIIKANGIPNHLTGEFPNQGNPNAISPQKEEYEIPLQPTPVNVKISAEGKRVGVLFSGVELDPFTAEFFMGTNGQNRNWNITTLTSTVDLGLDCNNGHVQPGGKYHYHGTPNAFLESLGFDGSSMIKVGYAADGYPIYYKFGYDSDGSLVAYESGYELKEGNRPGDGMSAPNGSYDGTYMQDYEYIDGSELDECNGRWGKTPESENEYYYLITDNFPSSPICFSAEPSQDFIGMQGPPQSQAQRPRHSVDNMFDQMDANHDGFLIRSEIRGPLLQHFDEVDANNDGRISKEELKGHRPPQRP